MTTYYVSSEVGSDNNGGTSQTAPLATLQDAANLVRPGDTVEVMNGTYTGPDSGNALEITTSGTAAAPITFEAAPGQTPVINSSGEWAAINIQASYININGFTVVGDAANYNLASATAGYGTGNPDLDGNGIYVVSGSNGSVPNHVTISNNTVYNEPGNGICTGGADYVQVLNNVVHNNGNWSEYGCSGISIWTSANSDTAAGTHMVISGNTVYDNAQLVPTNGAGVIEDGEGIILDTNPNFVGQMLVQNNTVYGNGSSGIESYLTPNAVISGNTVYGNDVNNIQAASVAQIFINQSSNNTVTNNNTTGPGGTTVAVPTISTGSVNSNESVTLTGTGTAGATVTVSDGGSAALGTTTANSSGAWTFTTADLAAGSYAFTATDTLSGTTSAASAALDVTIPDPPVAAPTISKGSVNSNDSVTLTGTGAAGATVTVSDGGSAALGTTTANSSGAWSFTTADLAAGSYAFTATDTLSGTTSAKSAALDVTVAAPTVAAPTISKGSVNSNDSVTLTGTGAAGATVTVSDGGSAALGTTTANSSGAWSFTTADLAAGSYAFTATDTLSGTTSAKSAALDVTVAAPTVAAPKISKGSVNSNDSVTLTGTGVASATVTVSDGGSAPLGTTTANSSGAWSFTTADLAAGSYAFTATDTLSGTTSAKSAALDVTVAAPTVAVPTITKGTVNRYDAVKLTGTAAAGATVTVSDGGSSALGTTTASRTGAWSFKTADLAAGSYAFTATDTLSGTTSKASTPFDLTVPSCTAAASSAVSLTSATSGGSASDLGSAIAAAKSGASATSDTHASSAFAALSAYLADPSASHAKAA